MQGKIKAKNIGIMLIISPSTRLIINLDSVSDFRKVESTYSFDVVFCFNFISSENNAAYEKIEFEKSFDRDAAFIIQHYKDGQRVCYL